MNKKELKTLIKFVVREEINNMVGQKVSEALLRELANGTFDRIIQRSITSVIKEYNLFANKIDSSSDTDMSGMINSFEPDVDNDLIDENNNDDDSDLSEIRKKYSKMIGLVEDGGGAVKQKIKKQMSAQTATSGVAPSRLVGGNASTGDLPSGDVNPEHLFAMLENRKANAKSSNELQDGDITPDMIANIGKK